MRSINQDLDLLRLAVARRRRILVSLVTLVLGTTSVVVEARECPAVVVGTNDPATDVLNIQQAVDGCASVRLQGKFSFAGMSTGEPLRVITLRRSVNIAGQLDDRLPRTRAADADAFDPVARRALLARREDHRAGTEAVKA